MPMVKLVIGSPDWNYQIGGCIRFGLAPGTDRCSSTHSFIHFKITPSSNSFSCHLNFLTIFGGYICTALFVMIFIILNAEQLCIQQSYHTAKR